MRSLILLFLLATTTLALAEPTPQLKEKGGYETSLTISSDGRFVAVNHSRTVSIWDLKSMQLLHTMKGFERVSSFRFTPDSKSIVVADYPRWIGYFDLTQGFQRRWEFKAPWSGKEDVQMAGSYGLGFSPDGRTILAADGSHGAQMGDDVVRFLSCADGKVLNSFPKWGGRRYRSQLSFVDNDTFVRGRNDKLQLYSVRSGEKLKEVRVGGDIFRLLGADERGILCRHRVEGGSRTVERLYSNKDLSLVKELNEFDEIPTEHPDGQLTWKGSGQELVVSKGGEAVFQGEAGDSLRSWIRGAGFVVSRGEGSDMTSTLYDASGKKLALIDSSHYYLDQAPVGINIRGYGGPCSIIDLTRGKELTSISFASSAAVSEDGRRMVVLMKTGVLVIDLAATLKKGELVLLR